MFKTRAISDGIMFDSSHAQLPYIVRGVSQVELALEADQHHVGMVALGRVELDDEHGSIRLEPGMFFSLGESLLRPATEDAKVCVISAPFYKGLRQFGGPLEMSGRLRYVDGCSDTLLLGPSRKGEPCLNHLHIPAYVNQRLHFHPSDRVGIIFGGHGVCCTEFGESELNPATCWHIPAGMNHNFKTESQHLDVITWHPDSDFGPSDENHPMINRTWVRQNILRADRESCEAHQI
ncbi:MAG TPA: hypothetical protein VME23_05920 [Terracidiphilus sp.]|nr:hypothetical protein [Terracidiphilus sp.]